MSDTTIQSWRTSTPVTSSVSQQRMLLVAGAVLGVLALVAAVTWGISRLGPRAVPIIEPDPRPIKIRPAAPGGLVVPNQDETIFDRPSERRAAPATTTTQLAPGPEAPQIERLREQLMPPTPPPQALTPATPATPAAPAAPARPGQPAAAGARPGQPAAPATATPAPATPAAPAATRPAGTGRAQIQLGALASEEAARAEWGRLQHRVPELAGHQAQITRFEREGQPTLWRLRTAGFADAAAARAACEAVRAKGAACTVPGG